MSEFHRGIFVLWESGIPKGKTQCISECTEGNGSGYTFWRAGRNIVRGFCRPDMEYDSWEISDSSGKMDEGMIMYENFRDHRCGIRVINGCAVILRERKDMYHRITGILRWMHGTASIYKLCQTTYIYHSAWHQPFVGAGTCNTKWQAEYKRDSGTSQFKRIWWDDISRDFKWKMFAGQFVY